MTSFDNYLAPGKRGHLIGVGGVSMSPLAEVLAGMGLYINGSDMSDGVNVQSLREKGITVIMITHYMEEAALADRILVLHDGNVLIDGTPSEVFEQEALLKSCGLNVPQCTALVHQLREHGLPLEGDCVSIEQCAELLDRILKKEQ